MIEKLVRQGIVNLNKISGIERNMRMRQEKYLKYEYGRYNSINNYVECDRIQLIGSRHLLLLTEETIVRGSKESFWAKVIRDKGVKTLFV